MKNLTIIVTLVTAFLMVGCGAGHNNLYETEKLYLRVDFNHGFIGKCGTFVVTVPSTYDENRKPVGSKSEVCRKDASLALWNLGLGGPGLWGVIPEYLKFSLIQLDEDVFSITSESESQEDLDKYTLLAVAEMGMHHGFKHARFDSAENRDVSTTTTTPTVTTTTGKETGGNIASGIFNSAYSSIYGVNNAFTTSNTSSTTTTSGGVTTTETIYKRVHRVKYLKDKTPGAFNLALVAKSVKGNDEWEIEGLN